MAIQSPPDPKIAAAVLRRLPGFAGIPSGSTSAPPPAVKGGLL
ncbi:hypothetical protein [Phyllobacterium sp. SB3]